jgi:STE24 endopeptidase
MVGGIEGIVQIGVFLGLFALLIRQEGLFTAFGVSRPSVYVGIVATTVILKVLWFLLSIGSAALSRRNERQADDFAVDAIGSGEALASGLMRLSKDSLSNLTPHPFYVALNYSHPPVLERIRRLKSSA